MRQIAFLLVMAAAVAGVVAVRAPTSGHADEESTPIFGIKIPPGYRDWKLISVAREEGDLNDIRAKTTKSLAEPNLPWPAPPRTGFNDGRPADEAVHQTCFRCHEPVKARDFVFTRYAH